MDGEIQAKEDGQLEFPGRINVADVRGSYPGNSVKVFVPTQDAKSFEWTPADQQMNEFFQRNPNLLVTMMSVTNVGSAAGPAIAVLYTKQLTDTDLKELEEVQVEVRKRIDERKNKGKEAEIKAAEEEIKAQIETRRLTSVGRDCEEKKHREDLEKLRAELKKAKRAK